MSLTAYQLHQIGDKTQSKIWRSLIKGFKFEVKPIISGKPPRSIEQFTEANVFYNPNGNNLISKYFSEWSSRLYESLDMEKELLGKIIIRPNLDSEINNYTAEFVKGENELSIEGESHLEKLLSRIENNNFINEIKIFPQINSDRPSYRRIKE